MLSISASQFAAINDHCFARYIDRLSLQLATKPLPNDVSRKYSNDISLDSLRQMAIELVAKANALGIVCEGDVTPFSLLAICEDPAFKKSGLYEWITEIIKKTDIPAEQRMDAVYALLPEPLRQYVFADHPGVQ